MDSRLTVEALASLIRRTGASCTCKAPPGPKRLSDGTLLEGGNLAWVPPSDVSIWVTGRSIAEVVASSSIPSDRSSE